MKWLPIILLTGCAGSFEESRGLSGVGPRPEAYCQELDRDHMHASGVAMGAGAAAGIVGLAAIPEYSDKQEYSERIRAGLLITSAIASGVATYYKFKADSLSMRWARKCF